MEYTPDMMLRSDSGYSMPFVSEEDIVPSLGYGDQTHPQTGDQFFHHGLDFAVSQYMLTAIASGTVVSVGTDSVHGISATIRYGKYDVTYGHLSNVLADFGAPVTAGQPVAISGDLLHFSVSFDGQELEPMAFLKMLYANCMATSKDFAVDDSEYRFSPSEGSRIPDYENNRDEIERLLLRYLPSFFQDIQSQRYALPLRTEQSLRNAFQVASDRQCYHEQIPSYGNPLGLGSRGVPVGNKIVTLFYEGFLDYLASTRGIRLPGLSDYEKKKNLKNWKDKKEK